MKRRNLLLICLALCLSQARATTITTYSFNVAANGVNSSGTLTTTAGLDGADEITGITGLFSSVPGGFSGTISGLSTASYSALNPTSNGPTVYDNLFYPSQASASCSGQPGGGLLDYCGLDFFVTSGSGLTYEVNVFGTGGVGTGYELIDHLANSQATIDSNLPVDYTAVTPEPSTWLMTITGLIGLACALKWRFSAPLRTA